MYHNQKQMQICEDCFRQRKREVLPLGVVISNKYEKFLNDIRIDSSAYCWHNLATTCSYCHYCIRNCKMSLHGLINA